MKPSRINHSQGRLFEQRFSFDLDKSHPLLQMGKLIDWHKIEEEIDARFEDGPGQPPKPVRLVVGILMLQHMFDHSDEGAVELWMENPYWQAFCGYDYFAKEAPLHASSLPKWRKRIGVTGFEKILSIVVEASLKAGLLKKKVSKRS